MKGSIKVFRGLLEGWLVSLVAFSATAIAQSGSHHIAGKFGNGLCFNGVDDSVRVAYNSTLDLPTDFTIEAFVKVSTGSHEYGIVTKTHPTATQTAYYFALDPQSANGQLDFKYNPAAGGFEGLSSHGTIPLLDGNWHHVAVTRSGDTVRFYVDGIMDGDTTAAVPAFNNTFPVLIGNNAVPNGQFSGVMDEVRISNIARNPSEFCLTGECTVDANTLALWHFNEPSGNTANDETSNNNDGAIYGSGCQPQSTIPTLSEWGLIIFSLLLLGTIAFYLRQRKLRTQPLT